MPKVRVYDAPAGCTMGLEEEALARLKQFDQAVVDLQSAGRDIVRFNLGWDMREFAENPTIREKLDSGGVEVLPLITVDDEVVFAGTYPSQVALVGLFNSRSGDGSG